MRSVIGSEQQDDQLTHPACDPEISVWTRGISWCSWGTKNTHRTHKPPKKGIAQRHYIQKHHRDVPSFSMEKVTSATSLESTHPPSPSSDRAEKRPCVTQYLSDDTMSPPTPDQIPHLLCSQESPSATKSPSFHVLIATIGRESIFGLLESLRGQLRSADHLTIVYDGMDEDSTMCRVQQKINTDPAFNSIHSSVIFHEENLGFWGHGVRNRYNDLQGDFVLHADDDDLYLPGAFDTIRRRCTDRTVLYTFPFMSHWGQRIPGYIRGASIGTPSGVIPAHLNRQGTWGMHHGGDFHFYESITKLPSFVRVELVLEHLDVIQEENLPSHAAFLDVLVNRF